MKSEFNQFLIDNTPQTALLNETKKLVKKWKPSGLLDGLNKEYEVNGMAVLLENQTKQLVYESSRTNLGGNEAEQWSNVALPLVRRIFGEVAAKEFVSVQPMNLPSGLIFYMDFKYGNSKAPFEAGKSVYGGTVSGITDTATGGLYGSGRFGYSINNVTASVSSGSTMTVANATYADVNFDTQLSASIAAGEIKKITVALSSLPAADAYAVKAFSITSSTIDVTLGAYAYSNGTTATMFVSASAPAGAATISYSVQPTADARGDFEQYSAGTPISIPEVDLAMKSIPIIAKTRKLKATWTPELAQDLSAYHSVDAEAELTGMLSEYVSMEIDLEILDMLINAAEPSTEYWTTKVGYEYNSNSGQFELSSADAGALAYQKNTWFQTLGIKVQKLSNIIHQKTLRGGANFLVCSPTVATILETIPGFTSNAGDVTDKTFAMGVQKIGSLANSYTVYKNPYMTTNTILVGFKGNGLFESGAAYCPYVPLIMTPLVYDPNTYTPSRGVMSRYAKKVFRPEFYGKIVVAGLETL